MPPPFDYRLIRSSRRSLAIEVRQGQVIVRVPRLTSQAAVQRFVAAYQDRVLQHLARQAAQPVATEPTAEEAEQYRRLAHEKLPAKVAHWAQRLGVRPSGFRVTSARTRFGSCSSKGSLCFSWRLMRYPEEAIDYVVLHEVAHLKHLNHSPAFYQLIASHMPDYRRRQQLLKAIPTDSKT